MLNYRVTLTPDDGTVLVTFADVPEAITFGADEQEALMQAIDALETGLSFYVDARQPLHESALAMALEQRRPAAGLIHHTDRGILYRTGTYRAMMAAAGIRPSMSGRKSAYDNAMAESFFSNLKNELVHRCDFATRDEARAAIFDYIELFNNRSRIH